MRSVLGYLPGRAVLSRSIRLRLGAQGTGQDCAHRSTIGGASKATAEGCTWHASDGTKSCPPLPNEHGNGNVRLRLPVMPNGRLSASRSRTKPGNDTKGLVYLLS